LDWQDTREKLLGALASLQNLPAKSESTTKRYGQNAKTSTSVVICILQDHANLNVV
jgi:hypothetical protein